MLQKWQKLALRKFYLYFWPKRQLVQIKVRLSGMFIANSEYILHYFIDQNKTLHDWWTNKKATNIRSNYLFSMNYRVKPLTTYNNESKIYRVSGDVK